MIKFREMYLQKLLFILMNIFLSKWKRRLIDIIGHVLLICSQQILNFTVCYLQPKQIYHPPLPQNTKKNRIKQSGAYVFLWT